MTFCRFARVIYIKPRRSCVTVVISFGGRAPGVSGGAGRDVVDVGSALHPTAMSAALLAPLYVVRQKALGVVFGAFGVGREVVLRRGIACQRCRTGGRRKGGGKISLPSPLFRPPPSVPTCSMLARQPPAVAVAVCFEKNTALSRGWCTPLTRGSAVCGAKRIAQHANPGLLS